MSLLPSTATSSGSLTTKVIRASDIPDLVGQLPLTDWPTSERVRDILAHGLPQKGLPDEVNAWRTRNLPYLWKGLRRILAAKAFDVPTLYGAVWLDVMRADGTHVPYGLGSLRVVTEAGVTALVAAWSAGTQANQAAMAAFRYHGIGTSGAGEAASNTTLGAELTTQLNPDSTRATGNNTAVISTGSVANILRSVATVAVDATAAVTEHGLFNQEATGGGTLWDRSTFSAVNLSSGDSIQFTYDATFAPGG